MLIHSVAEIFFVNLLNKKSADWQITYHMKSPIEKERLLFRETPFYFMFK